MLAEVLPAVFQRVFVKPNELELEKPYIHRNIMLTQQAYNLHQIAVKSFPVAVGRTGWETPLGTFHVFQMLRDPDWEHPLTREIFEAGEPGNDLRLRFREVEGQLP